MSKNKINIYEQFAYKAKFKTELEEYEWAKTQTKKCSVCNETKTLDSFNTNTAGDSPFNKEGLRYRRGECSDCTQKTALGKQEAIKIAKNSGNIIVKNNKIIIPKGTKCGICDREATVFDHDHISLKHRGWLCDPCNRSIGILSIGGNKNEILGLIKAFNYLNKTENISYNVQIIKEIKIEDNVLIIL